MNQRWRLVLLWALPIVIGLFLLWQVVLRGGPAQVVNAPTVAPRNSAVARMTYGRFLDYVDAGRVTAVDIFDGEIGRAHV